MMGSLNSKFSSEKMWDGVYKGMLSSFKQLKKKMLSFCWKVE